MGLVEVEVEVEVEMLKLKFQNFGRDKKLEERHCNRDENAGWGSREKDDWWACKFDTVNTVKQHQTEPGK
jgi:hypothetical protein